MNIVKGLLVAGCLVAAVLSACGGGGGGSGSGSNAAVAAASTSPNLPAVNISPDTVPNTPSAPGTPLTGVTQANAGQAQTVVVGTVVTLDGSASTVQSGRSLTYSWTFLAPSGHAISGASTVHPSFTADTVGTFGLQLLISDGLSSSSSSISVTAAPGNAAINVALVASRASGVAPLAVFFDASATTATTSARPFHELEFQWNFGETNLGNWSQGAHANVVSRNVDTGPVAAHVFETPGTYSVKLNATDGANVGSTTVQITVTDPNTVFAASTACVSVVGAFTGCPTGAAKITSSDYAAVINDIGNALIRCFLFNRGESWTASAQAIEMHNGPGLIGAYGSGAAPKWVLPAGITGLVLSDITTPTISDWRVMDLEINGQTLATSGVTAGGSINQVLLLRLNIHDINDGITFDVSTLDYWNTQSGHAGQTMWDQLAIVDSRVNTIFGGVGVSQSPAASGYSGAYISAARLTFMGNNFDNANGGEHVLRTPYIGKGVVSHNYLARPDAAKHCFKLHAPSFTGTGVVGGKYSEQIVIADNTFDGGKSVQNVKLAPQNGSSDERIRNVLFERNYFLMGVGAEFGLVMEGPVSVVSVRNNIFNSSNSTDPYPADIEINGGGMGATTSVNIYNNTLYTTSPQFKGVLLLGDPALISNVNVKNNLAYAPSAANATFADLSVGSNVVGSNNSTDVQTRSVSPLFGTVPALSATSLLATDFKPATASYATGGAPVTLVLSDFNNALRAWGAASDLGAVNH